MRNIIMKKLSLLAAFALVVFSFAGCANNMAHGGLVPDVSGPETAQAGVPTSYSISASTDTDYAVSYGINWGDGSKPLTISNSSSSDLSGEHAWAKPGAYKITATATNGHGESGFSFYNIQVVAAPSPEADSDHETTEATGAPEALAPVPVPDKPAPPLTVIISNDPLPALPPAPTGPLKMVAPPTNSSVQQPGTMTLSKPAS